MNNRLKKLNIKDWAEEDRPREKLLSKGVSALSDAELLAILIGSGNRDETAVELAQRILHSSANNLNALGKLTVKDLMKFNGIGDAKAITVIAAMELGRRRKLTEATIDPRVCHSQDIYEIMHPILGDLPHEETWLLLMNKSNRITKRVQMSRGGLTGTVVDIRSVMKEAIDNLATAMILCHNHPSGGLKPSLEDDQITFKLKDAGETMDIPLLDHLIICDGGYYSYRDEDRI